jgi:hypothetical protein
MYKAHIYLRFKNVYCLKANSHNSYFNIFSLKTAVLERLDLFLEERFDVRIPSSWYKNV